jgi:cell division protein FtsW
MRHDKPFLALTLALVILGLIAVADTSNAQAQIVFDDPLFFFKQQAMWAAIGVIGLFATMFTPYKLYSRFAVYFFGFTLILLILVLIPGIGSKVYGARRWLSFGSFGFQPSEVAKLAVAIMIAKLASQKYTYNSMLITVAIVLALIMLQPDLGTTIIVSSLAITQIFLAGIPIVNLVGSLISGLLAVGVLILTSDYRRERLATFISGAEDPRGSGYHIHQILIALGSGGVFGVGLGQSIQKHLFLPESATDSVFAIIAEEIGFVGSLGIIILLTIFVLRAFRITSRAPDTFSFVLAGGISAWLAAQIFFNLSSMVALTPLTGIPLPFFSYGGTSLTMLLISIGILLNISSHEHAKK